MNGYIIGNVQKNNNHNLLNSYSVNANESKRMVNSHVIREPSMEWNISFRNQTKKTASFLTRFRWIWLYVSVLLCILNRYYEESIE